jgi:hypothetical protein
MHDVNVLLEACLALLAIGVGWIIGTYLGKRHTRRVKQLPPLLIHTYTPRNPYLPGTNTDEHSDRV